MNIVLALVTAVPTKERLMWAIIGIFLPLVTTLGIVWEATRPRTIGVLGICRSLREVTKVASAEGPISLLCLLIMKYWLVLLLKVRLTLVLRRPIVVRRLIRPRGLTGPVLRPGKPLLSLKHSLTILVGSPEKIIGVASFVTLPLVLIIIPS